MPHPVQSAATTGAYLAATAAAAAQTHANTTHHLQEQDPDSSRRTLRPTLYLPPSTQRLPFVCRASCSTYPPFHPPTYLPTYLSTYLFTNPLFHQPTTYQPTNQPTYPPTHPPRKASPIPPPTPIKTETKRRAKHSAPKENQSRDKPTSNRKQQNFNNDSRYAPPLAPLGKANGKAGNEKRRGEKKRDEMSARWVPAGAMIVITGDGISKATKRKKTKQNATKRQKQDPRSTRAGPHTPVTGTRRESAKGVASGRHQTDRNPQATGLQNPPADSASTRTAPTPIATGRTRGALANDRARDSPRRRARSGSLVQRRWAVMVRVDGLR